MNVSITIANVIVAIVAMLALTNNNDELPQLRDRLTKLEVQYKQLQATTNPSIQQNKHSYPTNTKDSSNY